MSKKVNYGNADGVYGYSAIITMMEFIANQGRDKSIALWGPPGIGKTMLIEELGRRLNMPVEKMLLSQQQAFEIGGGYLPDRENNMWEHFPTKLAKKLQKVPHVFFADEFNAGISKSMQAVAYSIFHGKMLGAYRMHPDTLVVGAGNRVEDAPGVVVPFSQVMNNRLIHFNMGIDVDSWCSWAIKNNISPDVISYVGWRRDKVLYENNGEPAFPTPRSVAAAGTLAHENLFNNPKLFGNAETTKNMRKRLITATVGEGWATGFLAYCDTYRTVDSKSIVENGADPGFNDNKQDLNYAIVYSIASYLASREWAPHYNANVAKFLKDPKFQPDLQTVFLNILPKDRLLKLASAPEFRGISERILNLMEEYGSE